MNSLNKYVPTIVFVIGLSLLIFSVRTFFHPGGPSNLTPIANRNSPTATTENGPTIIFRPATHPPPVISRTDPKEEFLKELKKPAQNYLARVGLKMNLPDGYAFAEETDGPVQVLIGASEPGKSDFYIFAAKGKYHVDKAVTYLKQYFADEFVVTPKGKPEPIYSRGGFSDMNQMKGLAGKIEYQAYFFSNAKMNQSYLVMLMNRNILKAPARVRELIDSVSSKSQPGR